jgi:hypothetical protein
VSLNRSRRARRPHASRRPKNSKVSNDKCFLSLQTSRGWIASIRMNVTVTTGRRVPWREVACSLTESPQIQLLRTSHEY